MKRILHYTVSLEDDGLKTEAFLKKQGISSKLLIKLKATPIGITLDGEHIYTTRILHTGDVVTLTLLLEHSSENIVATELPFPVVYEDEDIVVVDKPANMPIHPSQGNFTNTLANAAAFYFQSKGEPFIFRAINRLDRDTTGLLILAKNPFSACFLSDMMKAKKIHRQYLSVVSGCIDETGTIDAPIDRTDSSTIERCVNFETGANAVTHYKRLHFENGLSLALIKLDTGRTHQIRVHFKYIGHPLLGDFLYNPDFTKIGRQTLHSHTLSFPHPVTGESLTFTSPLPDDMANLFTNLYNSSNG